MLHFPFDLTSPGGLFWSQRPGSGPGENSRTECVRGSCTDYQQIKQSGYGLAKYEKSQRLAD